MAAAASTDGMIDIRSAAILEDVEFNKNMCAPGVTAASIRGPFYRGATKLIAVVTSGRKRPEPYFSPAEDELNAPDKLDTVHSWIGCLCSAAVIFVVCGLVYSYGIWISEFFGRGYGIFGSADNQLEVVLLIGAFSMSLMILFGPVATLVIRGMGYRLTAIGGLLLMFFGILVEGLVEHLITFIVSRALFLPIGASFAYTAAHHISNVFAKHLIYAMLVLSCSTVLGILFFFWFIGYLLSITGLGYHWVLLIICVLLLVTVAITYAFPRKFLNSRKISKDVNKRIAECIKAKAKATAVRRAKAINPDSNDQLRSCFFVCVCNVASCDYGFLLWLLITMMATLTFHVPYLFIYVFVTSPHVNGAYAGVTPNSLMGLLLFFCIGNLLARLYVLLDIDFTFIHNRTLFQVALIGSGILYFVFKRANTWGWIAVWLTVVGITQGLMSATIPRVTLQTVPTAWLKAAWVLLVLAIGVATFLGPVLLIVLGGITAGLDLPYFVIGLLQCCGAIFTFLIPNEEANFEPPEPPEDLKMSPNSKQPGYPGVSVQMTSQQAPLSYSGFQDMSGGYGSSAYASSTLYSTSILSKLPPFGSPCGSSSYGSHFTRMAIARRGNTETYVCNCPICAKIGPLSLPDCSPCLPLAGISTCSCNQPPSCACGPSCGPSC